MSTKTYLASLMAKRFSGSSETSEENICDGVYLDKVDNPTVSYIQVHAELGVLKMIAHLVDEVQTSAKQVYDHYNSFLKAPDVLNQEDGNVILAVETFMTRFRAFVFTVITGLTTFLSLAEAKVKSRPKSQAVVNVKKKIPQYSISVKYNKQNSSHILHVYSNLVNIFRLTISQAVVRIYRETKNLLWKLNGTNITNNNVNSDEAQVVGTPVQGQQAIRVKKAINEIQSISFITEPNNNVSIKLFSSTSNQQSNEPSQDSLHRSESDRAVNNFADTQPQANRNTLNQSRNSQNTNSISEEIQSERSTMDAIHEIIAEELAALEAGEVVDVFDAAFGRGDNYFDEMNANMLREDAIPLPILDDMDEEDFDPIVAEGVDYEENEALSPPCQFVLPRMSPSPIEERRRFLDDAYANYIATTDNLVILSHNTFDEASESEDEIDSHINPKRPRLDLPEQKSPSDPA